MCVTHSALTSRAAPGCLHETRGSAHDHLRSSSCRRVLQHLVHVNAAGCAVAREEGRAAHELALAVQLLLQLQERTRVSKACEGVRGVWASSISARTRLLQLLLAQEVTRRVVECQQRHGELGR